MAKNDFYLSCKIKSKVRRTSILDTWKIMQSNSIEPKWLKVEWIISMKIQFEPPMSVECPPERSPQKLSGVTPLSYLLEFVIPFPCNHSSYPVFWRLKFCYFPLNQIPSPPGSLVTETRILVSGLWGQRPRKKISKRWSMELKKHFTMWQNPRQQIIPTIC